MNNPLDFILSYSNISKRNSEQKSISKQYSSLQEIVYGFSNELIINDSFMIEDPVYLNSKRSIKPKLTYATFNVLSRKHWWNRKKDCYSIKLFFDGVLEITSYSNKYNNLAKKISSAYRDKENKETFLFYF